MRFSILFNEQGKDKANLRVGENCEDLVFDAVKLSFNGVGPDKSADVRIGGNC